MIVYIAGPMKGKAEGNKPAFMEAQRQLEEMGCIVLNPARLPDGMPADAYMPICIAMVQQADAVYCLPGWAESLGAMIERNFAFYQNKLIFEDINHVDLAIMAKMNFDR